jgi:hypothetical protein
MVPALSANKYLEYVTSTSSVFLMMTSREVQEGNGNKIIHSQDVIVEELK